jgi:TetR/AcrR family transcriptional regulator, mexJK operon transcriptional repressor
MPTDARKPGRPLDMAKREAILQATRLLMNRYGAAFTVDMVAEQAGVSKQTVYNSFSGKEDIIVRVVESIVQEIGADLDAFSETDDVRMALIAFGSRYLRMVGNKDRTNFLRLIIGAAARGDQTVELFFRSGPKLLVSRLSDFLVHQRDLGHLQFDDPQLAAEQFIGLVLGTLQMRLLLGVATEQSEADVQNRVTSAIDLFLKSYGSA